MNVNLIVLLLSLALFCFAVLVIVAQRGVKKKLVSARERLAHLEGRINLDDFEKDLKKISVSKWDKQIEEAIEKFSLIDSLSDVRENVENFDELTRKLDDMGLFEVKQSIARVRYQTALVKKYGKDIGLKLINHKYFVGMTEEQLVDCKGSPTKIEQEVLKTKTKTIYIYGNKSSGDVFTFVDGELERYKDR